MWCSIIYTQVSAILFLLCYENLNNFLTRETINTVLVNGNKLKIDSIIIKSIATLPTAEILGGNNVLAWVSMVLYLRKKKIYRKIASINARH